VLWDRGTWAPVIDPSLALKKGELKFTLHGEKLAGKWVLVKIKGDDPKAWLLIKEKDEHVRPSAELDIVSARPESVVSGRGLAEVAAERDRLWHSKAVRPGGEVDPGGPAEGEGGERLRLADLSGAVRGPLPRTQPLALAMVVEVPPAGDDWLHESDGLNAEESTIPAVPEGQLSVPPMAITQLSGDPVTTLISAPTAYVATDGKATHCLILANHSEPPAALTIWAHPRFDDPSSEE